MQTRRGFLRTSAAAAIGVISGSQRAIGGPLLKPLSATGAGAREALAPFIDEAPQLVQDRSAVLSWGLRTDPQAWDDLIELDVGSDPGLSDAVVAAQVPVGGASRGQVVSASIDSLRPDEIVYYRTRLIRGGTALVGPIRQFQTQAGPESPFAFIVTSDSHYLDALRESYAGETRRCELIARMHNNILQERDALNRLPAFRIDCGDHLHAKYNQQIILPGVPQNFPIDEFGMPIGDGLEPFATSQLDADRLAFLTRLGDASMHSLPTFVVRGNHEGSHHWHYAENNGGVSDTARYVDNAIAQYYGSPNNTGIHAGPADHDAAAGLYFSFRWGPARFCVFNTYRATRYGAALPPILPFAPANFTSGGAPGTHLHTLGADQWQYFFNEQSGIIPKTSAPFIFCFMHNLLGGKRVGPNRSYGWGLKDYCSESVAGNDCAEHDAGNQWSNPYGYQGTLTQLGFHRALVRYGVERGKSVVVFLGHGHFYCTWVLDGVRYVQVPRPAGEKDTPYDDGHFPMIAYDDPDPEGARRSNAGHIFCSVAPARVKCVYRSAYIDFGRDVAAPSDGIVGNQAIKHRFVVERTYTRG